MNPYFHDEGYSFKFGCPLDGAIPDKLTPTCLMIWVKSIP